MSFKNKNNKSSLTGEQMQASKLRAAAQQGFGPRQASGASAIQPLSNQGWGAGQTKKPGNTMGNPGASNPWAIKPVQQNNEPMTYDFSRPGMTQASGQATTNDFFKPGVTPTGMTASNNINLESIQPRGQVTEQKKRYVIRDKEGNPINLRDHFERVKKEVNAPYQEIRDRINSGYFMQAGKEMGRDPEDLRRARIREAQRQLGGGTVADAYAKAYGKRRAAAILNAVGQDMSPEGRRAEQEAIAARERELNRMPGQTGMIAGNSPLAGSADFFNYLNAKDQAAKSMREQQMKEAYDQYRGTIAGNNKAFREEFDLDPEKMRKDVRKITAEYQNYKRGGGNADFTGFVNAKNQAGELSREAAAQISKNYDIDPVSTPQDATPQGQQGGVIQRRSNPVMDEASQIRDAQQAERAQARAAKAQAQAEGLERRREAAIKQADMSSMIAANRFRNMSPAQATAAAYQQKAIDDLYNQRLAEGDMANEQYRLQASSEDARTKMLGETSMADTKARQEIAEAGYDSAQTIAQGGYDNALAIAKDKNASDIATASIRNTGIENRAEIEAKSSLDNIKETGNQNRLTEAEKIKQQDKLNEQRKINEAYENNPGQNPSDPSSQLAQDLAAARGEPAPVTAIKQKSPDTWTEQETEAVENHYVQKFSNDPTMDGSVENMLLAIEEMGNVPASSKLDMFSKIFSANGVPTNLKTREGAMQVLSGVRKSFVEQYKANMQTEPSVAHAVKAAIQKYQPVIQMLEQTLNKREIHRVMYEDPRGISRFLGGNYDAKVAFDQYGMDYLNSKDQQNATQ